LPAFDKRRLHLAVDHHFGKRFSLPAAIAADAAARREPCSDLGSYKI